MNLLPVLLPTSSCFSCLWQVAEQRALNALLTEKAHTLQQERIELAAQQFELQMQFTDQQLQNQAIAEDSKQMSLEIARLERVLSLRAGCGQQQGQQTEVMRHCQDAEQQQQQHVLPALQPQQQQHQQEAVCLPNCTPTSTPCAGLLPLAVDLMIATAAGGAAEPGEPAAAAAAVAQQDDPLLDELLEAFGPPAGDPTDAFAFDCVDIVAFLNNEEL